MFEHKDTLEALNKNIPLSKKLRYVHTVLQTRYPFIERIAAALYESDTDKLKTFLYSSSEESPLQQYEAKLSESGSLLEIKNRNMPRVINDLRIFDKGTHEHTLKIKNQGYAASYTLPMFMEGEFFGFLFFNSYQPNSFNEEVLHYVDIFGHLIIITIANEIGNMRNLLATVKTAKDIAHSRDLETGCHLDRMSHYCRIIARQIANKYRLSDEFIEHLFIFSPLHDIGKISTPDSVLLKADKLTENEYEIMKQHTSLGRNIIDNMIENFSLENLSSISVLRNIAELHHEAINGEGYPHGLKGNEIPIEARIVAVADVFDALTSRRPYKQAWSNERAFDMLKQLAGVKLDADCIDALEQCRDQVEEIQRQFKEDPFG